MAKKRFDCECGHIQDEEETKLVTCKLCGALLQLPSKKKG